MSFDLNNKAYDNTLIQHLDHVTRFEHDFNDAKATKCFTLFEIAVEQFNTYLSTQTEFKGIRKLIAEGSEFSESQCRAVTEGYTWVLLKIKDDRRKCELHLPLNLLEYANNPEPANIINMHYALQAVHHGESHCEKIPVDVDPENMTDFFHSIEEREDDDDEDFIDLLDHPMPKLQRQNAEILSKHDRDHPIKEEDDNAIEKISDLIKKRRDGQFFEPEDFGTINELHQDKPSEHFEHLQLDKKKLSGLQHCSHDDKERVIELYNAQATEESLPGYVLYTENITECATGHGLSKQYKAVIEINDSSCYFGISNDIVNGTLTIVPDEEVNLPECTELFE